MNITETELTDYLKSREDEREFPDEWILHKQAELVTLASLEGNHQVLEFLNKEGNEEIMKQFKLWVLDHDEVMDTIRPWLLDDEEVMGKIKLHLINDDELMDQVIKPLFMVVIDYEKSIYPVIMENKDEDGIDIKTIIEKAIQQGVPLNYIADRTRIFAQLTSKAAKKAGILHIKGTNKYKPRSVKKSSRESDQARAHEVLRSLLKPYVAEGHVERVTDSHGEGGEPLYRVSEIGHARIKQLNQVESK